MPARVARSSTSQTKATNSRSKKSQKRTLDAFSIASHSAPDSRKVRQHRLGETISDGPKSKRRRVQDDDVDDDEDEEHASKRTRGGRAGGLDDDVEEGSDSDGNEWRMGGPIGDDSDESLDSDEAFGESDEERFDGFTFRGSSTTQPGASKKKSRKPKARQAPAGEMDLDEASDGEDESEEDSDFGDEGVDLATMLDYNSDDEDVQPEKKRDKKKATKTAASDEDEDMSDDEEEDDEDEDEDEDSDSAPSEAESDDADPDKLSKLQDLIASLDNDPPEKRAARTADVHESQQPSAFGLSATQKLKISDLLPTVTDPALRKSLKLLSSDKTSKRSAIPGKLDAPLPKRQQDRLDRAAATQVAKETLDKWRDTVVQNRRAEFLQFPLQDPNASAPLGQNTMIAVQQEKPQNNLESAIQNILVESGLSNKNSKPGDEESQLQEFEELKMNKIPIEEVMARRADLRKARELLFREEAKAKRIKKIKSKSYRRVHRKERERAEAKDREFREAEGIESDEDEKDKRDRKRAEERMGTKHRDSKWAKGMKKSGRTVWDDDARDSMLELARRNEDLRKRIEGKDVGSGDDSDFSEDEEDDEDDDMEDEDVARKRLATKLDKLNGDGKEQSRLGNMLFMKRAEAGRKAQNDEEIERLRKELAGIDSADEEDADTTVGRRSFGPKAKNGAASVPKPVRAELEENPASDEEGQAVEDDAEIIVDRPTNNGARKPKSILKTATKVPAREPEPEVNGVDDDNEWLSTATKRKSKGRKPAVEEPLVSTKVTPAKEIKTKQVKAVEKQPNPAAEQSAGSSTNGWTTIPYTAPNNKDNTDEVDNEDTENPMLAGKDKQALFHQRAFAGDDVAVDFEAEKAAQMEDEDDKVVSNHLPGWGAWAGDGLSKAAKRQNKRIAHNPLHKKVIEGTKAANRKDAKLKNVVISEAQQRKSKKYLASQLPHQFEKRDQYERSLRIPVGPEWTTKETFQRNTRPRVVVKQGIVEAMEKPLV